MPFDPTNSLANRSVDILRANGNGYLVKPAPSLYPHTWSWDSALIATALSHIDLAIAEIRQLFRGHWRNGMVPQIQFNPTRYWCGHVWPVINWLMWYAWQRIGEFAFASDLRAQSLEQIESSGFYDYISPITGTGLDEDSQSWAAAAVLDWLANGVDISRVYDGEGK